MSGKVLFVAAHTVKRKGQPWSGTLDDVVELATNAEMILAEALGEPCHSNLIFAFTENRTSAYASVEEFKDQFVESDVPSVKNLMIFTKPDGTSFVGASMYLGMHPSSAPSIEVTGDEQALVYGIAARLETLFPEQAGVRKQSLRRRGDPEPAAPVPWMRRARERVGAFGLIAITAAVTAAVTVTVTVLITKALG
jgi:hypothetical protein